MDDVSIAWPKIARTAEVNLHINTLQPAVFTIVPRVESGSTVNRRPIIDNDQITRPEYQPSLNLQQSLS